MRPYAGPIGFVLVGTLFILLFFGAAASKTSSNNMEQFLQLQASFSDIVDHPQSSIGDSRPAREEIIIDHIRPEVELQDLLAVNAVKVRDLDCEELQREDGSKGMENSLNLRVVGSGSDIEEIVDGILSEGGKNEVGNRGTLARGGQQMPGNYLNVEVQGITVSAINTVQGGSAVATSNIIIKPVQIITYPSEVEERLR
jgi:hypothetical protein